MKISPAPIWKRGLTLFFKLALGFFIVIAVGVFLVLASSRMLPTLDETKGRPKIQDFCGRYIALPGTARFLSQNYPGAHTWLDFKNDGTYVFNEIPHGNFGDDGHSTQTENGTWQFSKSAGEVDSGSGGSLPLHLKGLGPSYLIVLYNSVHLCPMWFCIDPVHSPAVHDINVLSEMDWSFQGIVAFSIFLLPLFLPKGSASRAVGCPFVIMFLWGLWRMAYYDPVMENDVPGMGYLILALVYPLVSGVIYIVRRSILGFRARKKLALSTTPHTEV